MSLLHKILVPHGVDIEIYKAYTAAAGLEKTDPMYVACVGQNGEITYEVKDEFAELDREFRKLSDNALDWLQRAKKSPKLLADAKFKKSLEDACCDYADFDLRIRWRSQEEGRYFIYNTRENVVKHCLIRYLSKHLRGRRIYDVLIPLDADTPIGINLPGVQKMFTDFERLLMQFSLVNPNTVAFLNRTFTARFLEGRMEPMPNTADVASEIIKAAQDGRLNFTGYRIEKKTPFSFLRKLVRRF